MPAVVPPTLEMDKELAQWIQQQEVAAEKLQLGRDAATLEVVMEAEGQ